MTKNRFNFKVDPNIAGKYTITNCAVKFMDGTGIPEGTKVRVLDVSLICGTHVQIPAMQFATAYIATESISWPGFH